jgi:hypothetical protein
MRCSHSSMTSIRVRSFSPRMPRRLGLTSLKTKSQSLAEKSLTMSFNTQKRSTAAPRSLAPPSHRRSRFLTNFWTRVLHSKHKLRMNSWRRTLFSKLDVWKNCCLVNQLLLLIRQNPAPKMLLVFLNMSCWWWGRHLSTTRLSKILTPKTTLMRWWVATLPATQRMIRDQISLVFQLIARYHQIFNLVKPLLLDL